MLHLKRSGDEDVIPPRSIKMELEFDRRKRRRVERDEEDAGNSRGAGDRSVKRVDQEKKDVSAKKTGKRKRSDSTTTTEKTEDEEKSGTRDEEVEEEIAALGRQLSKRLKLNETSEVARISTALDKLEEVARISNGNMLSITKLVEETQLFVKFVEANGAHAFPEGLARLDALWSIAMRVRYEALDPNSSPIHVLMQRLDWYASMKRPAYGPKIERTCYYFTQGIVQFLNEIGGLVLTYHFDQPRGKDLPFIVKSGVPGEDLRKRYHLGRFSPALVFDDYDSLEERKRATNSIVAEPINMYNTYITETPGARLYFDYISAMLQQLAVDDVATFLHQVRPLIFLSISQSTALRPNMEYIKSEQMSKPRARMSIELGAYSAAVRTKVSEFALPPFGNYDWKAIISNYIPKNVLPSDVTEMHIDVTYRDVPFVIVGKKSLYQVARFDIRRRIFIVPLRERTGLTAISKVWFDCVQIDPFALLRDLYSKEQSKRHLIDSLFHQAGASDYPEITRAMLRFMGSGKGRDDINAELDKKIDKD